MKIFPVIKKTTIVEGGGDVPAGAAVMVDATAAKLLATRAETNPTPTETESVYMAALKQETNPVPTEAYKAGVSGPALQESNVLPTSAIGARLIFAANGSFTVPTGVTSITCDCWGGGSGGVAGDLEQGAVGGAGGDYARSVVAVTPAEVLSVAVGAASVAPAAGNNSVLGRGPTVLVQAQGGNSGNGNVGDTIFTGGAPNNGILVGGGGGGGGGAGDTGNGTVGGQAPVGGAGGVAGAGGTGANPNGVGGNGGAGGAGNLAGNGSPGVVGSAPGGGGGGGGSGTLGGGAGAGGARGQVRISWTPA